MPRAAARTRERLFAATNAYRTWALANRPAFLLVYGTPVPGYELPDGPIGDAAFGLAAPFLEVVFEGWSPEQLAALPLHPGAERLAEADLDDTPLPHRRPRPVLRAARPDARTRHAGAARPPAPR